MFAVDQLVFHTTTNQDHTVAVLVLAAARRTVLHVMPIIEIKIAMDTTETTGVEAGPKSQFAPEIERMGILLSRIEVLDSSQ